MPVITFGQATVAVLRLEIGREESVAGRDDDGPDVESEILSALAQVDCARRAGGDTLVALGADAAVQAAPGGRPRLLLGDRAALGRRSRAVRRPRQPAPAGTRGARMTSGGARTSALSTTASRSSKPSNGPGSRPCSQRSIMNAARLPWPIARAMSLGPGDRVAGGEQPGDRTLERSRVDPGTTARRRRERPGERVRRRPDADRGNRRRRTRCRTRCPARAPAGAAATRRARPAPRAGSAGRPRLRRSSPVTSTGATWNMNRTPSRTASSTSASWAGISSRPRR